MSAEQPSAAGAPQERRRHVAAARAPWWRRALLRPWAVSLGLLAACAPWWLAIWVCTTEAGFRQLAATLQSLSAGQMRFEQPQGRLSEAITLGAFHLEIAGVVVELRGLELSWQPSRLLQGELYAQRVVLRSLHITYPLEPAADPVPKNFDLPFEIRVDTAALDQLELYAQLPGRKAERVFGLRQARAEGANMARQRWDFRHAEAELDWGRARLSGSLSPLRPFNLAAQGHFATQQGGHPLALALRAQGNLGAMELTAEGEAEDVALQLAARINSFSPVHIERLDLNARGIRPRSFAAAAPLAELDLQARLRPLPPLVTAGAGSAMRVGGRVEVINRAAASLDRDGIPLEGFSATLMLTRSQVSLSELDLQVLGVGRVRGEVHWHPGAAPSLAEFGRIEGLLELAALDPARLHTALPTARLRGQIKATADARRQSFDVQLADGRLGLVARLHHAAEQMELERFTLSTGAAQLSGSASLALAGEQGFALDAQAQRLDPRALWRQAPSGNISGSLKARGSLRGEARVEALFALEQSTLAGLPLAGQGRVVVAGQRLSLADINLDALGNQLQAKGAFGGAGDMLSFRLSANQLDQLGQGFGGRLRARGTLAGTLQQPSGELEVFGSRLALPGQQRVDAINVSAKLREGRDGSFDLRATLAGYRPPEQTEQWVRRASLVITGTRAAHRLRAEAEFARARALSLEAEGGFVKDLNWSGQLQSLVASATRELRLEAPTALQLGPDHFELGSATLRGESAELRLETTRWTPGRLSAEGRLSGLNLGLSLNEDQEVVARGETLRLGAEWKLDFAKRANGLVRVFREAGDVVLEGDSPVELGITELEAVLAANDDQVAASVSVAGKRIGVISAAATAKLEARGGFWGVQRNGPLLGRGRIEVPALDWVGPLVSPNTRTAGSLVGDFSLAGTPADPVASGDIRGESLKLFMGGVGLRLSDGRLKVAFERGRVSLDELSFASPIRLLPDDRDVAEFARATPPGRIGLSGAFDLVDQRGEFRFQASHVPLLQRPDTWLMVSGEGSLKSSMASEGQLADLQMSLRADAGYIGLARTLPPSLGDDVVVRGRAKEAEAQRATLLKADIDVDLGPLLQVKALGIDTRLEGSLRVAVRPGEVLRASGRVETRDGVFDAYGQRLSIDEGLVTFQGPIDDPSLAITALRKGLPVEAGVRIDGSAKRPRIKLVSSPNVPDAEKLSWIVLGRGPQAGGEGDSAMLVAAAGVLLGDTTEGITTQIQRAFGIDQIGLAQAENRGLGYASTSQVAGSATGFTTSTAAAGSDTVSGQVIMVSKRLSEAANLSFEQSLQGSESLVKLSYALSKRISLILRAGADQALDLNYNISFD